MDTVPECSFLQGFDGLSFGPWTSARMTPDVPTDIHPPPKLSIKIQKEL